MNDGRPHAGRFRAAKGRLCGGRLDHDSEGLLLLTDDGALAHRLTDPRHKQPKTYLVQVDGEIDEAADPAGLRRRVLNDGPTLPAIAEACERAGLAVAARSAGALSQQHSHQLAAV
jgi:23S rRNA pseudouridine2457 synthase